MLCDGCDQEAHTYCLQPQLSEIPSGKWFCEACKIVKKQSNEKTMPVTSPTEATSAASTPKVSIVPTALLDTDSVNSVNEDDKQNANIVNEDNEILLNSEELTDELNQSNQFQNNNVDVSVPKRGRPKGSRGMYAFIRVYAYCIRDCVCFQVVRKVPRKNYHSIS